MLGRGLKLYLAPTLHKGGDEASRPSAGEGPPAGKYRKMIPPLSDRGGPVRSSFLAPA